MKIWIFAKNLNVIKPFLIFHDCALAFDSHQRRLNVKKVQKGLILLQYFIYMKLNFLTKAPKKSHVIF